MIAPVRPLHERMAEAQAIRSGDRAALQAAAQGCRDQQRARAAAVLPDRLARVSAAALPDVRRICALAVCADMSERAARLSRRLMPEAHAAALDALPFDPPHAKARAWLSRVIGVDFDTHACRQLGVSVGRVVLYQDGTFAWVGLARAADEIHGTRVILIPVPGDVVAVDPERRDEAWSLSGALEPLGWDGMVAMVAAERGPTYAVARDALSWLRHVGRDGTGEPGLPPRFACHARLRDGRDEIPMLGVLDWRDRAIDQLLLAPGLSLIAEDEDHAVELERQVDAWRRSFVPRLRPRFLVAEPA